MSYYYQDSNGQDHFVPENSACQGKAQGFQTAMPDRLPQDGTATTRQILAHCEDVLDAYFGNLPLEALVTLVEAYSAPLPIRVAKRQITKSKSKRSNYVTAAA